MIGWLSGGRQVIFEIEHTQRQSYLYQHTPHIHWADDVHVKIQFFWGKSEPFLYYPCTISKHFHIKYKNILHKLQYVYNVCVMKNIMMMLMMLGGCIDVFFIYTLILSICQKGNTDVDCLAAYIVIKYLLCIFFNNNIMCVCVCTEPPKLFQMYVWMYVICSVFLV